MEKSYGIEAARAQLGDIADHARTTGQTIALTRHGRTVAVIGPADTVKPAGGVEVNLHFPHADIQDVGLPALPRVGEQLIWVLDNDDADEGTWDVTEVQWHLSPNSTTVGVSLEPTDDHTKQLMDRQEAERLAASRARYAKAIDRTALPHVFMPGGVMPGHCKCGYPKDTSCHTDRTTQK
jgi:antitoxin (DNA-binding transcriptional repressor) of toxin-antitoxin stability system